MDVDVTYEGLVLMRGATITTTANGPFIGLAAPMPVGTNLILAKEGASFEVRVARVEEGTGAGIFLTPLDLLERLSPSAPGASAPPESPPEPALAEEAPAPVEAAAEPVPPLVGASVPEAPPETPAVAAPVAQDSEASPPSPAEATPASAGADQTVESAAPLEVAPASETTVPEIMPSLPVAESAATPAVPPDTTPASPVPVAAEAVPGAVTQVMEPSAVTAPVAAGDILQEMPLTNTGSVQEPSKSESGRDSDGDAGKKGRRRNSGGRGRKGK